MKFIDSERLGWIYIYEMGSSYIFLKPLDLSRFNS